LSGRRRRDELLYHRLRLTNAELAPALGVAPDWIEANSGIRERRWASAEQSTSDLAAAAVCDALGDAGLNAAQLDYLIGGTLSPDYQVPGIAPLVQRKLEGCRQIPALDLRVGCAAILYSLQIACGLIAASAVNTVACFGAEAQSKGLDISNRSAELSMLFGDGAGAVIVSREPGKSLALRIDDVLIATDGSFAEDLIVRAPGTANGARWFDNEQRTEPLHYGAMNGRSVILQAVRKLADAAMEITARNGVALHQVELFVPHQANANLLHALSKRLTIAEERVVINVNRFGNTSGASAFLALHQARAERRLHPDGRVLILAFAAGFTWGAALCQVEEG
jgi:3-oxoacyl-[acyl-carrier-protein] synthase-3